jgi:hypothetical protein
MTRSSYDFFKFDSGIGHYVLVNKYGYLFTARRLVYLVVESLTLTSRGNHISTSANDSGICITLTDPDDLHLGDRTFPVDKFFIFPLRSYPFIQFGAW